MAVLPESLRLRDGDLVLRDWREDDAPFLEPVCGDPDVCRFTTLPWAYTQPEALAWIRRQHDHRTSATAVVLAVTHAVDDVALGSVSLGRFSDDGRQAELGYWLLPGARGRGLATTAAHVLCAWGFEHLGLARIELAILPENVASRRVAERLGAAFEGVRPGRHEEGRAVDMAVYSLC
ncbi:MAG TPA: GNAT family N-acetyltransferase [Solirubrobacteraceae bacterium]|nr:GNAT family N-acetyltransferase [Solirubrobacteraceae bacterium]